MVLRQFWLLILISFWLAISVRGFILNVDNPENCAQVCASCGGATSFINGQCDCQIGDEDEPGDGITITECTYSNQPVKGGFSLGFSAGAKCVESFRNKLDSNGQLADDGDLINEERSARCALASRRLLRKEDANKVATYFLNGGPATGAAHLIPITLQQPAPQPGEDCDDLSDDSDVSESYSVGATNSLGKSKQSSEDVKENLMNNPAYATAQAPVYALQAIPTMIGSPHYFIPRTPYRPITRPLPSSSHLPRTRPRFNPVPGLLHPQTWQNIPRHLLRFASLPLQGLVGLNDLMTQRLTPPVLSTYDRGTQNILGSALPNETKVSNTLSTKEDDDDVEKDKPENQRRPKIIATRPRIGASANKQNAIQGQDIIGAPAQVYQQSGRHTPLLNIMDPPIGGYVLQLMPHGQHYPSLSTIVGSPHLDDRPLCEERTYAGVTPFISDSPVLDNTNDSAGDTNDNNDSEIGEDNISTERKVTDEQSERRPNRKSARQMRRDPTSKNARIATKESVTGDTESDDIVREGILPL